MSFGGTIELPHFQRTSFKTRKGLFASVSEKERIANIKLTPMDQIFFCSINQNIVYPVSNKWGLQGWTSLNLEMISDELLMEVLSAAFNDANQNK